MKDTYGEIIMKFQLILMVIAIFSTNLIGQNKPELIAPQVISTEFHETSSSFTPDGKTIYFTRSDMQFADNTILVSHLKNGSWSKPEVASFSGIWRDSEPHVSPDGAKLFFVSNRPTSADSKPLLTPRGNQGANIWYVSKIGNKWSEPVHLEGAVNGIPTVYNPSVARNGNLYFSGNLPSGGSKNQIYFSKFVNGQYEAPLLLPFSDSKWNNLDPYISPDERFMLFVSDRAGDFKIHITYQKNGQWSEPKVLSDSLNSKRGELAPSLAPDGKTLYFTSGRKIEPSYPKPKETINEVNKRLHQVKNGSRNIWRMNIVDLINW